MILLVNDLRAFLAGFILHALLVNQLAHGFHMFGELGGFHHTQLEGDDQDVNQHLIDGFRNQRRVIPIGVILSQAGHTDADNQHDNGKNGFDLAVKDSLPLLGVGAKHHMQQDEYGAVADHVHRDDAGSPGQLPEKI